MSQDPLDSLLRPAYRVGAMLFLGVGLVFFAFPDGTIDTLNRAGAALGLPAAPHLAHRFWLGLGVAYMAAVTALAWLIAEAPVERRLLMLPLAIGKATSAGTCLLFFAFEQPYFVYLANFMADSGIAVGVLYCWRISDPARRVAALATRAEPALGTSSRRVLRSVCEAFLPSGGAFERGAEEIGLAEKVEAHLLGSLPQGSLLGGLLMHWIDWQPLLFHGRARRFQNLALEERARVLESMEASRIPLRRQPLVTLKLLLGLHGYRDAEVKRQLGVDSAHFDERLRIAAERREAGGKGPYPIPGPPPAFARAQVGG